MSDISHKQNNEITQFSIRMIETVQDKLHIIDASIGSASYVTQQNQSYTTDSGHTSHYSKSSFDFVYSGVYLVNQLQQNDKTGHIFDFGTFSDNVELKGYVWNATLEQQTVTLKTHIGDTDGVEQIYQTITLNPTEQREFTITATADGETSIDGQILTTFTTTSTPLTVLGSRVLIFIFEQERNSKEVFEFLTNISKSYNNEYRQKLRDEPRHKANKSFKIFNNQYGLLEQFTNNSVKKRYNIPLWADEKYFFTELTAGAVSIDYGDIPEFSIDNISNLLVYKDKDNYEVVQIVNIIGTSIALKKEIDNTYNRYRIVPLYNGYITGLDITNINKYSEFDCEIITNESVKDNGVVQFDIYNSYYVNSLDFINKQSRDITQDIKTIDNDTGLFEFIEERLYNNDIISVEIHVTKEELNNYKSFLFYTAGQLKPFWIHSRKEEFIFDSFDGINFDRINVSSYAKLDVFKDKHCYFVDDNNNYYYRKINTATELSVGSYQLIIDIVLPNVNIVISGFLFLVRFNSDTAALETKNSRIFKHSSTLLRLHQEEKDI